MGNKIRYYKQNGEEYSFSKEPQIKITQTSNADMYIGIPKKQTAVEWLVEQYANENYSIEVYEQAKAMEKEQIMEARLDGFASSGEGWNGEYLIMKYTEMLRETKCEQYYNETYGK